MALLFEVSRQKLMATVQTATTTASLFPSQIGRYRIRAVLGRGAMGVVYLAHDPQLDREVALKTIDLPQELSRTQRGQLARSLLQEARMVAKLTHPGIMQVYDAGLEKDLPFIVLENLAGQTLEKMLASHGRLPAEVAFELIRKILEAMACAHAQGIIHRDLKPGNIMVQPNGEPRVMDFGIAHALADTGVAPAILAGTPRYMAPEQILAKPVDQRADVFALGAIAYLLLAGRQPFPQNTFEEIREAITHQPHLPLGVFAPNLPEVIYVWIERALAKKPTDRHADAGIMLEGFVAATTQEENETLNNSARQELLNFILRRIERQGDFPATAEYLSIVSCSAHDETASAQKIAAAILKDFALTNRILRLVNSPAYRGRGGTITTISRAVVILGVDTIFSLATGLGIFEHFHNRCDVSELKLQAIAALLTALHARQLAKLAGYAEIEEAFISGMLYHLGRLIVAFYFAPEHQAIQEIMASGETDEERASRQVMRLSYSEIGGAVAEQWRLPETMRLGMQGLPKTYSGPAHSKIEKLQAIVQCAEELGRISLVADDEARKTALKALARRHQEQLPQVDSQDLQRCMQEAVNSALDISGALKIDLHTLGVADTLIKTQADPATTGEFPGESADLNQPQHVVCEAKPEKDNRTPVVAVDCSEGAPGPESALSETERRQDIIMRTLMEITTALMSSYHVSDVLMMVLEGMYRGLDLQHVMIAMLNPEHDQVHCRFGLGENIDELRKLFQFPLDAEGGLPARCMLESRDITLLDALNTQLDEQFPQDFLTALKARSIVLLPIVIQGKPIGCFCVDRSPDQLPPTRHELRDLKTLANQAVLAIQQSLQRR